MKAVVQRVSDAAVLINGAEIARIGEGLLVLLGVADTDTSRQAEWMAGKIARLRIFPDGRQLMNRSIIDTGGEVLLVSQFTLLGDTRRGNRPSFASAAEPGLGKQLYLEVAEKLRRETIRVKTGEFGAMMKVQLTNEGPVTIILESIK